MASKKIGLAVRVRPGGLNRDSAYLGGVQALWRRKKSHLRRCSNFSRTRHTIMYGLAPEKLLRLVYEPFYLAISLTFYDFIKVMNNAGTCLTLLVSIHKWPFSAISASISGIACATYLRTSPRNFLISLTLQKIAHL